VGTEPRRGSRPADSSRDQALEDIVAEFILAREEGRNPSIDDYLTRHPKHAEDLARLLACDTHPPARRSGPRADRPAGAQRIGPYEVLAHVSTAGGGTVYRARHVEAGHVVALKVLDARGAVDARDVERFHREAAMLRALNLVHVVPVLDAGEEGGRNWIAMKWLEGDTFASLREAAAGRSHRLHDLRERARLVARVARTFAAIHGYGILHRDVKPSNIMVDATGEPMIIDFGIAQAPDLPELTATTDQVMGTPRFLAPELLSGGNRQVSQRTDVYGLGLCLYELCTGAEAFKHETRADLFTAIRTTGPVHPRRANAALSHDLAAVVLRAIEIDPARRYPDMATFADDLDRIARGDPPEPVTLRGAHPLLRALRRHKKGILAAACLAAVVVPSAWMAVGKALDRARAAKAEETLRPFAWFAPEAFAGGVGVPSKAIASELAANPAATPAQRLVAAWVPYLAGDVREALADLGTNEAPDDPFATRILREWLSELEERGAGHAAATFVDTRTSMPAVNPETGRPYELLMPAEAGVVLTRASARLAASVERVSRAAPPRSAADHLTLASLVWSTFPNAPGADTSEARATIEASVAKVLAEDPASTAARHLRGVMRFLAKDARGAREDFEAVLRGQPAALGTRYLLGIVLSRLGEWAASEETLARVARELPPSHAAGTRVLGRLALAQAGAGRLDPAIATCERWWSVPGGEWQDAVMPRMIAAGIRRQQGRNDDARDLLVTAIRETERIGELELARQGKPVGPQILVWAPAVKELFSVAEAVGDLEIVDEIRAKIEGGAFGLLPVPPSAEAYLDLNLCWLRCADVDRARVLPGGFPTAITR
jgi:hypothetical protein